MVTQAELLFVQPNLDGCQTDEVFASPNGRYLAIQYNCEANLFIYLLNLTTLTHSIWERGYFLDWSPDGNWFLFRHIDNDQILLIEANNQTQQPLPLPIGTYRAAFAPDGQHITYAASRGLGFGSELGLLNLIDDSLTIQYQFPDQIVATPRWSPNGSQLVYILMLDTNIPYTVGELWLADTNGQPVTLLDQADAGHGYPPAWSPDGTTVAYIRRENPDSLQANRFPEALHSNIYQVTLATGEITQLTQFSQSHLSDLAWSPNGSHLAFVADNAVWLLQPETPPVAVSQNSYSRYPVWLTTPTK